MRATPRITSKLLPPEPYPPMKKLFFSLGLIAVSAFYILLSNQSPISVVPPVAIPVTAENNPSPIASGGNPPVNVPASSPSPAPTSKPATPAPTPAPTPLPTPKGLYVNGTYTGSVADAYYGNVQVEAIINGGKLADVQFLQYPDTHSTSVYINSQAMPYLKQEAIQAQSANVNIISGATDTSMAFQQSLGAALAQAKS
jgi:uncharacterized protein with FMN-binding domain